MMAMQPAPPSPDHYEDRRAAAATVKRLVDELHEPLWGDILLEWTSHYDGLERYLWPEEDPVMEVRDLLQRYVDAGESLEPERFAGDLADLRFCYCAARHDNGDTRWDPFHRQQGRRLPCERRNPGRSGLAQILIGHPKPNALGSV